VIEVTPVPTVTTHEYEPEVVAVVEHRIVLLAPVRVTKLPAVAVPDTVGVRLVTTLRGETMLTVGGARAVKLVTLGVLVPPWLLATAVTEVAPALTVTTHEKLPPAVAVVEHSTALPGPLMVTTLLGVAVPDITGEVDVAMLAGA
jgi:hypothetical protein